MFRRMKQGRIALLLAFLMLFSIILHHYLNTQELLILESNQLLTGHEIRTQKNYEEIIEIEAMSHLGYRLFAQIESHSFNDIWLFYTNDFSNWRPPLSEGIFFSSSNTKEAVVGRNVELIQGAYNTAYIFNGKEYEVIGVLGLLTPSLLDDMVLINDLDFLRALDLGLIVDYDDADILALALGEPSFNYRSGIGSMLETDFFTPLINIYGRLISGIMTVIIAFLYYLEVKDEIKMRRLIGERRLVIFGKFFAVLLSKISMAIAFLWVIYLFSNLTIDRRELGLQVTFLLLLLMLSYTAIFFRKNQRKERRS